MKRTIAIALVPSADQRLTLCGLRTIFAAARNIAAGVALEHRCTNRVRLHHLVYYRLREAFPTLGAQMACNAIASVARSLKAHRANGRAWKEVAFRSSAAVHFDARTYRLIGEHVSLFTPHGRQRIPMRLGGFQRAYLNRAAVKESELIERRGRWYLHIALDLPDAELTGQKAVLGVDLGENVTAATNTSNLYGGGQLRDTRDRFLALRRRLQRNGSQSARQLLARVSGRESRHVRHVNHEISAKIVAEAVETGCGTIAMENLTNIRARIKAGKRMRTRLHRWAWRQLQTFVEYKAQAVGLAVIYVDPAFTSKTCSACGNLGARRKHRFSCKECGIFAHSDRNAARNIAKMAWSALHATGEVVRPHVVAA